MAVDFDPEERSFLCAPHAEEAIRSAGVLLEDLRPRALESFDEPTRGMAYKAYEQRRQYQWRLVREERMKLEAKAMRASKAAEKLEKVGSARGAAPTTTGGVPRSTHEAALQQMVARETRALERELRAEAQRQRLERKQEAASEARAAAQAEKERQRALKRMQAHMRGRSARSRVATRHSRPSKSEGSPSCRSTWSTALHVPLGRLTSPPPRACNAASLRPATLQSATSQATLREVAHAKRAVSFGVAG